jgi:chromosome partitioning protein
VKQYEGQQPLVIAMANQKGGVGKTTTSVNLASEFARRGQHVLLVDCDPQGNATTSLGIAKRALKATTYDVLMNQVLAQDGVIPTGRERLALMPADENLAGAMVELAQAERRERRMAEVLAVVRADYDLILIDCPPSLGLLTINALCAATHVFIPLQCEYLALEGLAQLKGTIDRVRERLNRRLAILGVVMTMYDGRTNLAQQVVQEVRRYFPAQICNTLIPRSVRASEAPSFGQTLAEYDPPGRATMAYAALANELLTRIAGLSNPVERA